MKKLFALALAVLVCSTITSAQVARERMKRHRPVHEFRDRPALSPAERMHIKRDFLRYRMAERRAGRDGIVTPMEKRRLHQMRKHNRQQFFRFRHNDRRLV